MTTIFSILTGLTGNLVYHLVAGLALILIVVLAARKVKHPAIGQRARHVLVGCGVLLTLQVILFSLSLSVDPQQTENLMVYGLIERLVHALAIVWLVWTFNEPNKRLLLTGLAVFLSIALIILCGISVGFDILQTELIQLEDNLVLILWQSGTIILILSGLILTLVNRPEQWGLAVSMLILTVLGYVLQLAVGAPTTYMGTVRLALTITLPWLVVLAGRFSQSKGEVETSEFTPEPAVDLLSEKVKPALIDQLLKINLTDSLDEKHKAVAHALSLSVISDICYLMVLSQDGQEINIAAGYDLIREETLQPASLSRVQIPGIMDAWDKKHPFDLHQAGEDIRDAATFTALLRYHRVGNLLAYPLHFPDQPVRGGVVFLSPYTNKQWGKATLQQMAEIEETLTQVLFSEGAQEKQQDAMGDLMNEINSLRGQREQLSQTLSEKEKLIAEQSQNIKQLKTNFQKEKLQTVKQMDRMEAHIQELTGQAASQNEELEQLEHSADRIRQLTHERDQIRAALADANARIKELETQSGQTGPIRLSMESQIVSLDSIAANSRLQSNPRLRQNNLNLEIINPDGRQMVKTDPELLQTILQGLLENAIMASEQGAKIQLKQTISYETGMLILQVTDYGEGLTLGEQKDLFSADHETIPGIGSVQSIRNAVRAIRVLNGKIWLRSKKEAFTTFRVQLPIRIID